MEILSVILEWLPRIITLAMIAGGLTAMFVNEKRSVREWLLLAVIEAEKALGGGTGQLKLRAVFEAFINNFPLISKFISFETFSSWVDISLGEMRKMLEDGGKIEEYVKGDE